MESQRGENIQFWLVSDNMYRYNRCIEYFLAKEVGDFGKRKKNEIPHMQTY